MLQGSRKSKELGHQALGFPVFEMEEFAVPGPLPGCHCTNKDISQYTMATGKGQLVCPGH